MSPSGDAQRLKQLHEEIIQLQTHLNTETNWHTVQALNARLTSVYAEYKALESRMIAQASGPSGHSAVSVFDQLKALHGEIIHIQTLLNTETDWGRAEALRARLAQAEAQYKSLDAQMTSSAAPAGGSSSSPSGSSSGGGSLSMDELKRMGQSLRPTPRPADIAQSSVRVSGPIHYVDRVVYTGTGHALNFPQDCFLAKGMHETLSPALHPLDGTMEFENGKWVFRTYLHTVDAGSLGGYRDFPLSPNAGQIFTGDSLEDIVLETRTPAEMAVTAWVDTGPNHDFEGGGYVKCLTLPGHAIIHGKKAAAQIAPGGAGERPGDLAVQGH